MTYVIIGLMELFTYWALLYYLGTAQAMRLVAWAFIETQRHMEDGEI